MDGAPRRPEEFPVEIEDMVCPKCGGELSINSSREMHVSQISCDDCEFIEDYECPEDTATKRFYKKHRAAIQQQLQPDKS
jgi:ssDNA-binding Zn-finger/Zn-ribbon topoisomerase 1